MSSLRAEEQRITWQVGQKVMMRDGSERTGVVLYVNPETGEGVCRFEGAMFITILRRGEVQKYLVSEA